MNRPEFDKEVQSLFAFKVPKGTLDDLFKLANGYAASFIPDYRMVGDQYKSTIFNNYLTKEGFKDDSWPNYEGWIKEYDTFNLLVHVSSRENGNYTFGITTCNKGIDSASDPSGKNRHMYHHLTKDIGFEGLKQSITFFNSIFVKK